MIFFIIVFVMLTGSLVYLLITCDPDLDEDAKYLDQNDESDN